MHHDDKKTWHKHFDFMLLDLVCMEFSFLAALCIRFGSRVFQEVFSRSAWAEPYQRIMVIIFFIHILLILFVEPYSGILRRNSAEECKKVLSYNFFMLVAIVVVLFVEQSSVLYSRIVMFGFAAIDFLLMFVLRYCLKKYLQREINKKTNQDCMLLVAPYRKAGSILHRFDKNQISTVKIVGIVLAETKAELEAAATAEDMQLDEMDDTNQWNIREIPIVGALDTVYEYARTNVVDEVLICMENEEAEEIAERFMDMGITVHISIQNLIQIPRARLNRVNGIPVITAGVNMVTSRQLMLKRLIDIFFGFCGSVVTVLVTLIVAPMIWIADPGPVFFRQERVGRNGRTFKIWKFRTMYKDAEQRKAELMAENKMSGLMFKMDHDPRIIGAGKRFSLGEFLRKSSIDELPQSFNILAGSMSVVGTRPPTVQEYEQYELHHKGRLAMKPGLTGMWQVSGRSDITDFEEVVRLDKEYIDNFSLGLDLEIMLKTVKVVLGKEGSV